jgi:hypothetical protein
MDAPAKKLIEQINIDLPELALKIRQGARYLFRWLRVYCAIRIF